MRLCAQRRGVEKFLPAGMWVKLISRSALISEDTIFPQRDKRGSRGWTKKQFFKVPLYPGIGPAHRFFILVRHISVEYSWIFIENQREKVTVPFPHQQRLHVLHAPPGQRPFGVGCFGDSAKAVDAKNKAEPILVIFSESRPVYGSPQQRFVAHYARLFVNFPLDAAYNILPWLHLSAQTVVLSIM